MPPSEPGLVLLHPRDEPEPVWQAVAAGSSHSCAITAAGTLLLWGGKDLAPEPQLLERRGVARVVSGAIAWHILVNERE